MFLSSRSYKQLSSLPSAILLVFLGAICAVPRAHAIVNGSTATDPTGSVQVYLNDRAAVCTGTLINPGWVLMAAHCITNNNSTPPTTEVFLGSLGRDQGEHHTVLNIYQNPTNDVALLQLAVRTTEIEMVVPYGSDDPIAGIPATISGWGYTIANPNLPASTLQISQNIVASVPPLSATMQLTTTDGSQIVNGDSGAGVVVFGLVCGVVSTSNNLTITAVKTSAVADWIRQTANVYAGGSCNVDLTKKKKAGLAQRIMALGSAETVG